MASTFFILKAGIAPPDLASHPEHIKMMFWEWVVDLGLRRKDAELAKGLNAHGKPLPGVAASTRERRKSEMTPTGLGSRSAPYLMPGRGLSRTRSLLAGKAHRDYAEFFWRFDAYTGDQWGKILAHHAARGKAYDVVGLSPAGVASVAAKAQKRWRQWLRGAFVPGPSAGGSGVDLGRPSLINRVGRTDLEHADFGMGGSEAEYREALDAGRAGGFMTPEQWERYWRQRRVHTTLARPGQTAYSVRTGSSNVLLQHVWGGPGRPAAGGAVAAPLKPKPKPPAKRRAALKPTPEPAKPRYGDPADISTLIKVSPSAADDVKAAMADAMRAIESLHTADLQDRISAEEYGPDEERYDTALGAYLHNAGIIKIKSGVAGAAHTAAHEIGHCLQDKTAMAIWRSGDSDGAAALFDDFNKAARASSKIKGYLTALDGLDSRDDLTEKSKDRRRRWLEYLTKDYEIWARAYSLWVSKKSGSKRLADDLAALKAANADTEHVWDDDDFEPIAKEIETIFTKLGWLK